MRRFFSIFLLLLISLLTSCSSNNEVTIHIPGTDKYDLTIQFIKDYTPSDYIKECRVSNFDGYIYVEGYYRDENCTKRYNLTDKLPCDLYVKLITGNPNDIYLVTFVYENEDYKLYCKKDEKLNPTDFVTRTYGKDISNELSFKINNETIDFKDFSITSDLRIIVEDVD